MKLLWLKIKRYFLILDLEQGGYDTEIDFQLQCVERQIKQLENKSKSK